MCDDVRSVLVKSVERADGRNWHRGRKVCVSILLLVGCECLRVGEREPSARLNAFG